MKTVVLEGAETVQISDTKDFRIYVSKIKNKKVNQKSNNLAFLKKDCFTGDYQWIDLNSVYFGYGEPKFTFDSLKAALNSRIFDYDIYEFENMQEFLDFACELF